jgi:hypothetical protein
VLPPFLHGQTPPHPVCIWTLDTGNWTGSGSFVFGTQEVTVSSTTFNVNAVAAIDCDADDWADVVYVTTAWMTA